MDEPFISALIYSLLLLLPGPLGLVMGQRFWVTGPQVEQALEGQRSWWEILGQAAMLWEAGRRPGFLAGGTRPALSLTEDPVLLLKSTLSLGLSAPLAL